MRKLIFMCAGQGCHYYQMGRHLYETEAVFRHTMDRLDDIHQHYTGVSVVSTLYDDAKRKSDTLDDLTITHPAIFMVQYALGHALIDAGMVPDRILGSSLGEYVSLALANVVCVDELLYVVIRQAEAVVRRCREARMIAVLADAGQFSCLSQVNRYATVALVNTSKHMVVVTDVETAEAVQAQLRGCDIASQMLPIRYGFHTARIDTVQPECEAIARGLNFRPADHPIVSATDPVGTHTMSGAHLWRVVRDPVRFDNAVRHLEQTGRNLYVDLSPTGTLSGFVRSTIDGTGSEVIATMNPYAAPDAMSLKQLCGRIKLDDTGRTDATGRVDIDSNEPLAI